MARTARFDPLAILAALEASYVDYVLIGGLAQVLRGVDVVTVGVDICPSFARGNADRLATAVSELTMDRPADALVDVTDEMLGAEAIVCVATGAGELAVVASPAGIPNGYVDLRRAATREDLGGGVRPLVASSGDLAAMAAALGREQDLKRLPMLRRIVELEVDRGQARQQSTEPVRRASARRSGRRTGR